MNLDEKTVDFAGRLLTTVGFPVLCASYFMWKDYKFTKDMSENMTKLLERVHSEEK